MSEEGQVTELALSTRVLRREDQTAEEEEMMEDLGVRLSKSSRSTALRSLCFTLRVLLNSAISCSERSVALALRALRVLL